MKPLSDLSACVKDQCDPATSGASAYVGLEHIDSGAFFLSRYGKPSDVQSAKTRFRKGDILYGKLRPYLDKAVIAPFDGICSTDILALRPKPDTCATYLLSLIHTAAFRTHADQTTNGVNHPRTSWHGLAGFSWAVPSKPEQEKIAAVLRLTQRTIEVEAKLVANARELKQSAMRQLFTRGLRNEPQKETEIGPIPKSWRIAECDSICEMITVGIVVKPASHYVENAVPAFRSLNIKQDRLDTKQIVFISKEANDTILSKSRLRTDDVLVVRTGYPGTSCVVPPEYDGANCIDLVIVRPKQSTVLSAFLSRFFNSESGASQALRSSTGLAQQHLNVGAVKRTLVPLPSIAEQREIASILQTIDRKISVHERKRAALSDLFQTTLNQLMTAQIRVDKLDIDTTEVTA